MVAEFESDLIRLRTREGMKVAKGQGPAAWQTAQAQPSPRSALVSLVHSGEYSTLEVAELFGSPLDGLRRHRTPTRRSPSRSLGGDLEALTAVRGADVPCPTPQRDTGVSPPPQESQCPYEVPVRERSTRVRPVAGDRCIPPR
jgi:hypothetical protein